MEKTISISLDSREVFIPLWFKLPDTILLDNLDNAGVRRDGADVRNRNAIDTPRQSRNVFRRDTEKQFEVLAAMQCQRQRIQGEPTAQFLDVIVEGN